MEPDARQPDLEPDERVASLVNEYFDRREAGEELTPEQFASEHPELAGELQPYLEGLSFLDRIRSTAPDVQAALKATPVPGQLPVVEGYELIEEKGRGILASSPSWKAGRWPPVSNTSPWITWTAFTWTRTSAR